AGAAAGAGGSGRAGCCGSPRRRDVEQLAQVGGVGRRGRLVLMAEEDVCRRAETYGERFEVGVGVGRLAEAYVTVGLGVEVVDADDPFRALPGVVPEIEGELVSGGVLEELLEVPIVAGALDDDAEPPGPLGRWLH